MKQINLRSVAILVVLAISISASAQKEIITAFYKLKADKNITLSATTKLKGDMDTNHPWHCNIAHFNFNRSIGNGYEYIKSICSEFDKESENKNVTQYICMHGEDNAKPVQNSVHKQVVVKYSKDNDPIFIGSNLNYNVLVIRYNSQKNVNNRIVLAIEWKEYKNDNGDMLYEGTFYDIEGDKELAVTTPNPLPDIRTQYKIDDKYSKYFDKLKDNNKTDTTNNIKIVIDGKIAKLPIPDGKKIIRVTVDGDTLASIGKDSDGSSTFLSTTTNAISRLQFYTKNFDGQDNNDNIALLSNMLSYIKACNFDSSEQNLFHKAISSMQQKTTTDIQRAILNFCLEALTFNKNIDHVFINAMHTTYNEWDAVKGTKNAKIVLSKLNEDIKNKIKNGYVMTSETFTDALRYLYDWKGQMNNNEKNGIKQIDDIISTLNNLCYKSGLDKSPLPK